MAIHFCSTQRLVSSILPGADRPISALYAVRLGLVALCADLNRQCLKAHTASGADERLEAAFEAALAELSRTDNGHHEDDAARRRRVALADGDLPRSGRSR